MTMPLVVYADFSCGGLVGPILRGRSSSWPLREHGHAVAVIRGPVTTSAWWKIRAWRDEWASLGTGVAERKGTDS